MSRIVAAAATVAVLSACQTGAKPEDPTTGQRVQELRDRILVLRTRLAMRRNREATPRPRRQPSAPAQPAPAPSTPAESTAESLPSVSRPRESTTRGEPVARPATARPATAQHRERPYLESTLRIPPEQVPELEGGAAWLANLPRESARSIIRDNWQRVADRAQTIRLLVHMRRTAAEAILAGMARRVIWFDKRADQVRVYEPDHPHAGGDGTITIRIVGVVPTRNAK